MDLIVNAIQQKFDNHPRLKEYIQHPPTILGSLELDSNQQLMVHQLHQDMIKVLDLLLHSIDSSLRTLLCEEKCY